PRGGGAGWPVSARTLMPVARALAIVALAIAIAPPAFAAPGSLASSPNRPTRPRPPDTGQRPVLMPYVTGMPLLLAEVVLLRQGIRADVQNTPSNQPKGWVTAQAPPAGQPVSSDRPARLWVSSGPQPAPQPQP